MSHVVGANARMRGPRKDLVATIFGDLVGTGTIYGCLVVDPNGQRCTWGEAKPLKHNDKAKHGFYRVYGANYSSITGATTG